VWEKKPTTAKRFGVAFDRTPTRPTEGCSRVSDRNKVYTRTKKKRVIWASGSGKNERIKRLPPRP
jgi:hypothetical protein